MSTHTMGAAPGAELTALTQALTHPLTGTGMWSFAGAQSSGSHSAGPFRAPGEDAG